MRVFQPGEIYLYASPKRDGVAITMLFKESGVRVYSRTQDLTKQLKWSAFYKKAVRAARAGLELYGELWLPGGTASDVPQAIARRDPNLRFDVWGGSASLVGWLTVGSDFDALTSFAALCGQTVVGWTRLDGQPIDPAEWLAKCGCDVEGFVFSNGNLLDYCKLKPVQTADLVVLGAVEGEGKYAGGLGSLVVGTADGRILANVGSGLTDDVRFGGEVPTGQVVEVAFGGLTKSGRLRFPRFVRIRDDKTASDTDTFETVCQIAKGGAQ